MGYRLAPAISYCKAGGRRIFLDARRDRYFCLRDALDASFERWVGGLALDRDDRTNLASLMIQGVLVEQAGPDLPPRPCPAVEPACGSLFDLPARSSLLETVTACARFRWARLRLRCFGLAASLRLLERRKAHARSRPDPIDAAQGVAAAFHSAGRFATTRHHCLPHALAVAEALYARGVPCLLVIAVRTGPFGAHAWVQWGATIVNDRADNVRDYTPIRLV